MIALGFVVKIGTDRAQTTIGSTILPSSAFGFNRCAMSNFATSNSCEILDRWLPQLLAVRSDLDADDKEPILLMSPNQKGATEQFSPLYAIMAEDFDRGCISVSSKRPHYWPEHVSLMSCVPKPEEETFRKVSDYGHLIDGKAVSALGAYSVPPNPSCRIRPEFVQVWATHIKLGRSSASTPRP